MRSPDRQSIGLCAHHHRTGRDAQHVLGKRFEARHGINVAALIASLNEAYDAGQEWRDANFARLLDECNLLELVEPKSGDIARSLIAEMESA